MKYAEFQAKLTPSVDAGKVIGVRMPAVRKLAKEFFKEEEHYAFMKALPHEYYDENLIHAQLIAQIKDYEECVKELEKFLPFVDNWAVCDTMSPKVFKKHRPQLIEKIREWSSSEDTYTCRFGIGMLMAHFLDDDFLEEYLEIPASVHSEEYYVNMMLAWYFATALAKQWDAAVIYLTEERLDRWVHNKTIQKAVESYRITDEQKTFLRTLRRK